MSVNSEIEWTDATWNPVRGCTKISPGCKNCYAETFAERWRGVPGHPYEQGFDLRLVPEKLAEPLTWKKPRRVFVNSMSDLFQNGVAFDFIDKAFAIMAMCPQHTFQVLTKRSSIMREYFLVPGRHNSIELAADAMFPGKGHPSFGGKHMLPSLPFKNVWLGVSVENQEYADDRIPDLLKTLAAVRFLSCEPLLGQLNLNSSLGGTRWIGGQRGCGGMHRGTGKLGCPREPHHHHDDRCGPGVDWVIVGGESGHGARPCYVEDIRCVVMDCQAAGVPVFVKQVGSNPANRFESTWMPELVRDSKGGNMSEWPEDIRVREFPTVKL